MKKSALFGIALVAAVSISAISSYFLGIFGSPRFEHSGQQIYWVNATPLLGGIFAGPADGSGLPRKLLHLWKSPDSVVVDKASRRLFFTNMDLLVGTGANVQRADIRDGRLTNIVDVVPEGSGLTTPKQLALDRTNGFVYFSDREGRKVFRVPMEGMKSPEDLETLVDFTSLSEDEHQFVGIALDIERKLLYFTDRLTNRIWRVQADLNFTLTPDNIENHGSVILDYEGGMLIELALDLPRGHLYFTDRGEGNELTGETLPAGFIGRLDLNSLESGYEVIVDGLLDDPVGISISPELGFLYFSESESGLIYRLALEGGKPELLFNSYPFSEGMDVVDWNS